MPDPEAERTAMAKSGGANCQNGRSRYGRFWAQRHPSEFHHQVTEFLARFMAARKKKWTEYRQSKEAALGRPI
jgi:hypothetical protein